MRALAIQTTVLAATLTSLTTLLSGTVLADTVTVCGQTIAGNSTLAADLDCTGTTAPAVKMHGGSLAMNGFTIKGGTTGINCEGGGPCTITGPGTVTEAGIGINGYGKLKLTGVDVIGNRVLGVQCYTSCSATGPASIRNTGQIGEGGGHGITSTGTLKLTGLTIADNLGSGVVVGNHPQPRGKLVARNVVVTGNRKGIVADKGASLVSSTVTGNTELGISVGDPGCQGAGKIKMKGTTVSGNGSDGGCGTTVACADLAGCKVPLVGSVSSCGTSYVIDSGIPGSDWDVCTGD